MLYYLWVFPWLLFASYIFGNNQSYRMEYVPGIKGAVPRMRPGTAFIIILPIILWAGFRSFWFVDTAAYYSGFLAYPTNLSGTVEYIRGFTKDVGFYVCSAFFKLLIPNVRAYFIAIAMLQGILLMRLYRKYSSDYIISLFLFVASTDIFSYMFNGIRQFVAVTIIIAGTEYFIEKRYVKAILIILVASLFHQSALLFIPFVFIAQGKAWNKKTVLFLLLVIIAVIFVGNFTDFLDSSLQGTQYATVVSDYTGTDDDGTNPIRVLVYSVPAIIAFLNRERIREGADTLINFCVNMSIVTAAFYLLSMVTSGIYLGRLPIYFSLYNYILLPWEIHYIFDDNSSKIVTGTMVAAYLLFYIYQLVAWGYL